MTILRSLAFLFLFITCASLASAADRDSKPNVILIFIDDMGYGDIGPFGNKQVRTPNLDRLAGEGRKFHSFYATPVCSMSRASLMTGCYNPRVSIPGVLFPTSRIGLHSDETTLAEVVKPLGYATACIGKWHLGHLSPFLPTRQGFDQYFGIPYSNDMTIDPQNAKFAKDCNFREGMTEVKARAESIRNTVPLMRGEEVIEYPADQSTLTERYTAEAVSFIRKHHEQPFFIYLPHTMVHVPLAASDAFRGKSASGLLGDAVEEIDWSVGEIMKTLKELKLDERTLVIFTSDNGAATGSSLPFRGKKGTNYEGGVREPCIMRWPGKIPAGGDCHQMAGNIDLLPTLAKIVGTPLVDHKVNGRVVDGREITSLMFDNNAGPVRDVHLYFHGERLQAIRKGAWKLHFAQPNNAGKQAAKKEPTKKEATKRGQPPTEPELYNVVDDPYETKNVYAANPKIVDDLRAEAERRESEIRENKRPAGGNTFTEWKPAGEFFKLPAGYTLGSCSAAAVNSKGEVFVFHRGEHPIMVFDAQGKFLRSWGDDLIGHMPNSTMHSAHGLRIDRDDHVWVTDIGNHRVIKFDREGKVLLSLGTGKPGDGPDQFNKPTDVAFGANGEFYVTDGYGNSRVLKFSPSGALIHSWGQAGTGKSEFRIPHAIVIDRRGRLIVGDRENARIQIFDADGKLLDVWTGFAPYGLAFDRDFNLFVADGVAHQVLQLDDSGKVVHRFGKQGSQPGEFDLPHMLGFDLRGDLFVTEITGKRVQKFHRK